MKRSDLDELEGPIRALRDQQRRIDLGNWWGAVGLRKQKNFENERDKAMKDLKAKIDAIDWTKWEE